MFTTEKPDIEITYGYDFWCLRSSDREVYVDHEDADGMEKLAKFLRDFSLVVTVEEVY